MFSWLTNTQDSDEVDVPLAVIRAGEDGVDPLTLLEKLKYEQREPVSNHPARTLDDLVSLLHGIRRLPDTEAGNKELATAGSDS